MPCRYYAIFALLLWTAVALAQNEPVEPKSPQPPSAQPQPAPVRLLTPIAHLRMARTVYIENAGGNSLPFNIMGSAFEAWPRFTIVQSRQKADLVVEVSAPEESSGTSFSSSTTIPSSRDGRTDDRYSTAASHPVGVVTSVKMLVFAAGLSAPVWSGTEIPHGAVKSHAREDHMADATQKLFNRFHDVVEPPQADNAAEPKK